MLLTWNLGYHPLDPHCHPNHRLWPHFPYWHGLRGTLLHLYNPFVAFTITAHTSLNQLDSPIPLPCSPTNPRRPPSYRRLLPRSCPRRSPIRSQHPRIIRYSPHAPPPRPNRVRHLPQTPSRKGDPRPHTPIRDPNPRNHRKNNASDKLGANALRGHHRLRILPRRPPRPMSRALHHGFRIHRLRHHPHHPPPRRPSLVQTHRTLAGILRLPPHRRLGLRQHLHRTPLGPTLGKK